ncbi:MAG: transketolase [Candidatus Riflebacteria bacterium]|nr:transketolase [Candidatus Riflebacteria bacterium]
MRTAFFRTLTELAERDERITIVTGDLGFGVIETFANRFPRQFLNAGVAEQNMTGLAAGMALCGKTVFTYSIANFPTLRCLEQIRNDLCYHNANVKVVSVGGGFSYGALGATHHATEDLAILRSLPGLVVVAPGDPVETDRLTRALARHQGPCYLRLGRAGEPKLHADGVKVELGKALKVREGSDLTLLSTGGVLKAVLDAAERLSRDGKTARVLSMHTLKPLDRDAILAAAAETGGLVTVEEHSVIGGLGSAVADVLSQESPVRVPFRMVALPDAFCRSVGDQDYLRAVCGITVDGIVAAAEALAKPIRAPAREASRSRP